MTWSPRVLDPVPVLDLDAWIDRGGGRGLEAARASGPQAVLATIEDSGLRGRGGAGFPTGVKWRSVAANLSPDLAATVVVNGAEGEPGSFKDRAILLANPYRVLEGALIAAATLGADRIVVALKASAPDVVERVRRAIGEVAAAGWTRGVAVDVVEGPRAYLYGEETALLEVVNGREPFPRVAPPWRRGADDVGDDVASAAAAELTDPAEPGSPPPALVDNVETLANVPAIVAEGPDWFRSIGTAKSPGSLVVTVTGRTLRAGVAEVAMGTPLADVIEQVGGGATSGSVTAVLPGVSNAAIPADRLATPLTYEDMAAIGSALGAGSYFVLDESSDPVAVAAGASRFLAVESCGQCTPCKQDGQAVSLILDRLRRSEPEPTDLLDLDARLGTITDGARCFLATQHQLVVQSLVDLFAPAVLAHADGQAGPADAVLVAEMVGLEGDVAVLDLTQADKQPDWSYGPEDSGTAPADRLDQASGEAARADADDATDEAGPAGRAR